MKEIEQRPRNAEKLKQTFQFHFITCTNEIQLIGANTNEFVLLIYNKRSGEGLISTLKVVVRCR